MRASLVWFGFALWTASAAAQVTGGGTANTVPVFTGSSTIGDSPIAISGSSVGIAGNTEIGTATERTTVGSGSLGFNRRVWDGYIYNGAAYGYQFQHTSNSSPASDYLAWQIYAPNGYIVTQTALVVNGVGNVGIGTATPGYNLDVAGTIRTKTSVVYADGTQQTTAWTGTVCGGDYAESVDVIGKRTSYEPGDVLVIDPQNPGKFLKSADSYSTSVTGIYSTRPGLVGRRKGDPENPDAVPMAMMGIVPTKVTAENGPIHPGDLLVTSSTLGYAMKGTDRSKMLGAVMGKALGNLDSGEGVIEVVVMLQ